MSSHALPVGKDETARQMLARNGFTLGDVVRDHPHTQHVQFPDGWLLKYYRPNQQAIYNSDGDMVAIVLKGDRPRVHFLQAWRYDYHALHRQVLVFFRNQTMVVIPNIRDEADAKTKATAWLDSNHPRWRTALC